MKVWIGKPWRFGYYFNRVSYLLAIVSVGKINHLVISLIYEMLTLGVNSLMVIRLLFDGTVVD